jgi:hypothetical protein
VGAFTEMSTCGLPRCTCYVVLDSEGEVQPESRRQRGPRVRLSNRRTRFSPACLTSAGLASRVKWMELRKKGVIKDREKYEGAPTVSQVVLIL